MKLNPIRTDKPPPPLLLHTGPEIEHRLIRAADRCDSLRRCAAPLHINSLTVARRIPSPPCACGALCSVIIPIAFAARDQVISKQVKGAPGSYFTGSEEISQVVLNMNESSEGVSVLFSVCGRLISSDIKDGFHPAV